MGNFRFTDSAQQASELGASCRVSALGVAMAEQITVIFDCPLGHIFSRGGAYSISSGCSVRRCLLLFYNGSGKSTAV
jgi:hypothetical protein